MNRTILFDTHAHLDELIYRNDLDTVVRHALEDGVWIVTVGRDLESSRQAVAIAERYPEGVYAAVGLHPKFVPTDVMAEDKLLDIPAYDELLKHDKVIAIGDTGLDYSDLPRGGRIEANLAERMKENQKKVLSRFLEFSREYRMPLLMHCREAHDELLDILETYDRATPGHDARGIVHCFSGDWKQARRWFSLNFMISVTGVLTHGAYQMDILKKAPLTRLVAESDCPHAVTVPWGLRRSEPQYVRTVAQQLAGLRNMTVADVETQLLANAKLMFQRTLQDVAKE